LSSVLFARRVEPLVVVAVTAALAVASLAACCLPICRALAVDAAAALRQD
jgi:hypothetical protein